MSKGTGALLPCPFCGCSAKLNDCIECHVECEQCGSSTRLYNFASTAVDTWNTRAQPPAGQAVPESVEALACMIVDRHVSAGHVATKAIKYEIKTEISAYLAQQVAERDSVIAELVGALKMSQKKMAKPDRPDERSAREWLVNQRQCDAALQSANAFMKGE